LDDRVEHLKEALDLTVSRRRDAVERELAVASPDPEAVSSFLAQARQAWEAGRMAPVLFSDAGALVLDHRPPPDGTDRCLVRATVPKGLFIAHLGYANDSFITRELGRAAANGEMSDLIARLRTAPEFRSAGAAAEVVRAAIGAMRDDEYVPSLLVAPADWRLVEELALEELPSDAMAFRFPEGARHWFKGIVAGVPVLTWPRELTDEAVLIDIPRFGRWHQWTSTDGEALGVEVMFRDEAEAIALATGDGSIGSDETHTSVPERALKLQCEAVVQLSEHQTIEILDARAARRVVLRDPGSG
jgi:hypothetical protein